MKQFILEKILSRELDIKERIFRIIILLGSVVSVFALLECMLISDVNLLRIPIIILLAAMIISLFATFKYHKVDLAAMVLGFIMIFMVFPTIFFFCGGLEGGATVWFVIGVFYCFLMFTGLKLRVFLAIDILVMIVCYGVGYLYPYLIVPIESRQFAFFDSFFSVVAVGLACGLLYYIQINFFQGERAINREQNEKLQLIAESRSKFFSNMSHEFRTPLNTIIGLNEMIKRESNQGNITEYAMNVSNAAGMLLSLVNDIIDLSKIEMNEADVINVKYKTGEMLYELVDQIDIQAKEKNLTFNLDIDENIPSVLLGDELHIKQIMTNLLSNAVKYTEKGSVTLSAYAENVDDDTIMLNLSVEDTGIGIRKEEVESIYNLFERINAVGSVNMHGTGLGLTITKQLVDLLGGEITIDSIYTKGTSFSVKIKQQIVDEKPIGNFVENAKNTKLSERTGPSFEAPEARILIVENSKMDANVIRKLLKATNMQIDIADSGEQCLKMTKSKFYHVILLDYLMQDIDGVELFRNIRSQENGLCRESAVIVLTASSLADSVRICEENNFDGFIEKPINGAKLEHKIMNYIPEDIVEHTNLMDFDDGLSIQSVHRNHKRKILVTTDCVCDLPKGYIDKYNIGMMYLYIQTPQGRFADTKEIDSDNLTQYMDGDRILAKSVSVTVEEYEEFFADALTNAQQVIHISMAKNSGKSYSIASQAALGFDNVHVIDSGNISGGQGLIVLYAAKLAKEGYSADEIISMIEDMKGNVENNFIIPSAKVFFASGYTGRVTAKLSTLFGGHPILGMRQSKLSIVGLRWGELENSWRRFIRWHLRKKSRINKDIVVITHASCTGKQVELLKEEVLKCIPFERVVIQKASLSNSCNAGRFSVGIAFYMNADNDDTHI